MAPEKKNLSGGSGQPATRSNKSPLPQAEIELLPNSVTNAESAKKYLASTLLSQADEPHTTLHLTAILFQITQMKSVPLPALTAIRLVAFLLKKHTASKIAKLVAQQITESLSTHLVNNVIAAISPQVATILTTSESLKEMLDQTEQIRKKTEWEKDEKEGNLNTTADRLEEAADALYASIEDCHNTCKLLTPSLETTQNQLNTLATQLSTRPTAAPPPPTDAHQPRPTFSSITAVQLPPNVDHAIARASIHAKQILLDPTPSSSQIPPTPTSPRKSKMPWLKYALRTHLQEISEPYRDFITEV
ncbi:hypothetical protein DFH29DRAFT_1020624 [Suillus ampliporus]|nr:hypothetical protein DFH29DRAFT_1020624 [Suillus ampliporus]